MPAPFSGILALFFYKLGPTCIKLTIFAGQEVSNDRGTHQIRAFAHFTGARFTTLLEFTIMDMNNFFSDLQGKINQAIESSPAKDIEKNVKAMMTQGFSKLDLVTREEFDIQNQVLAKTRAKLEALEQRVADLEAKLAAQA